MKMKMKNLNEILKESKKDYKIGEIIPVMYSSKHTSNNIWEFGYIEFIDFNGIMHVALIPYPGGPKDQHPNWLTIVKFEDFIPDPKKIQQNLKKEFIEIGIGAGNYKILR
jgi:hypothetical protein